MTRILSICSIILLSFSGVHAQETFVAAGSIEFEKKINMHKTIGNDSWAEEIKNKLPAYRTTYFNLMFNDTISVYQAGRENPDDKWKNFWGQSGGTEDVVYQWYQKPRMMAIKQVFEKKFVVEDSLLHIEWKLTDETRTIAGFDCKKAVGRLCDTLYVVAFYTDQITTPTGPEQFHGLPGTILGLAFPRYYTTWFATKVTLAAPTAQQVTVPAAPKKAGKANRKELEMLVRQSLSWGNEEEKQRTIWEVVL